MHNAAFADHMARWGQLSEGVAEAPSDAAFLQPRQESLIRARAEVWEAKQRQLHHRAAAQQATRDMGAPAVHAGAAPPAGGNAPWAEADAAWIGGDVPQAEADIATLSRTARAGGGEVPQAAMEAVARGGTTPPAVEAAPSEFGEAVLPGRTGCVAPAALTLERARDTLS